jgi:uridine kinase
MRPRMIGLAGPSGAGKSTLAERAGREFGWEVVKLDMFFRDVVEFPMMGRWRNWEAPQNLKFDELEWVLSELRAGRAVEAPVYSKTQGRRVGMRWVWPTSVVLVEGFLLFSEQRVAQYFDLKLCAKVEMDEQRRRRLARGGFDPGYFDEVVRPSYAMYGAAAEGGCDKVIDLNGTPEADWGEFRAVVRSYLA